MSYLNKTLLALAGVLLLGASSALAQGVQFSTGGSFTQVRGEGVTENVGQVNLLATNAGTLKSGSSITITYSAPITAHAGPLSISCILGGVPVAPCPASLTVTVSGTQFVIQLTADQAFAVNDSLTISQVRVNASSVAAAGAQVTATPSAVSSLPATNPITFNPPFSNITVGVIAFPSSTITNVTAIPLPAPLGVLTCAPPVSATGTNFTFRLNEVIPNAWTSLQQEAAYTPNELDTVTNGSWISVTLTGIPAGFSVRADAPTASGAIPFPAGLQLISVGPTPAAGGTAVPVLPYAAQTATQTVANTPVVFTYAFVGAAGTSLAAVESAVMNYAIFATAPTTTVAPGGLTGTVTATAAYAPLQPNPAPTLNNGFISRFAASNTIGTVTVATISDCLTRLLMPWVLGGNGGYDTGIALANTSEDDVAFGTGPALGATAQTGSCTLTGYPTGGGTPIQATRPSLAAGRTDAFNLSQVSGFSGFSGYVLTVCNFLNAHAFVFISNGFGSLAGPNLAEGYLAPVIPNATRVAPFGEALGL